VWNNGDDPLAAVKPVGRRPFTTAISKDEGATWQHIHNFDTDVRGSPHGFQQCLPNTH
jgi:hypothetical protein